MTDRWEIQEAVDWVDNAFGGIEAEVRAWRPLGWLRALIRTSLTSRPLRTLARAG